MPSEPAGNTDEVSGKDVGILTPDWAKFDSERRNCIDTMSNFVSPIPNLARLTRDQEYGYAATLGVTPACEKQAIEQLAELRQQAFHYMKRNGFVAEDEFFYAEQNAKIVLYELAKLAG